MSAITRFFFRQPYPLPTTWTVVRWWESRRIAYNLAVGTAGIITLGVIGLTEAVPPHSRGFGIPPQIILGYALLANLFFCLGPVVDALVCRRWGPNYSAVGPTLFRYGFVFAVGVTMLPIPLAIIGWLFRFFLG